MRCETARPPGDAPAGRAKTRQRIETGISLPINIQTAKALHLANPSRHSSPRWELRGKCICLSGDNRRTACPWQVARDSVHDGVSRKSRSMVPVSTSVLQGRKNWKYFPDNHWPALLSGVSVTRYLWINGRVLFATESMAQPSAAAKPQNTISRPFTAFTQGAKTPRNKRQQLKSKTS